MRKIITALALVAGVVWLGAPAHATQSSETDREVCYETVMVEYIQKMTRTIESVDPVVWSKWTFWKDSVAFEDDGRDRGPLPHNNKTPGTVGYREYKYNVNGTLPKEVVVDCPETTVPETTVPETTVPDPETCVPEGVEVVDVDTGATYIYNTPTPVGTDTCGTPIPDICVDWGDHLSTLWTAQICEPEVEESPVAVAAAGPPPPAMSLPATGNETWVMAAIAALLLAAGGGAVRLSRR